MFFIKFNNTSHPGWISVKNPWSWLSQPEIKWSFLILATEKAQHPEPEVTFEDRDGVKGGVGNPPCWCEIWGVFPIKQILTTAEMASFLQHLQLSWIFVYCTATNYNCKNSRYVKPLWMHLPCKTVQGADGYKLQPSLGKIQMFQDQSRPQIHVLLIGQEAFQRFFFVGFIVFLLWLLWLSEFQHHLGGRMRNQCNLCR